MNISITSRKTTIKDSFRDRIEKKLAKFDRFFDDEAHADVTVTREADRETVEVTIRQNSMIYRAEKTAEEREDALDAVVDLLFKQIVKNKSKLAARMRAQAFEGLETAPVETESYTLVKQKKFPVRAMEVEEAILQMNMLDHQFFLFENPQSGELNIVYKRNSGDYGLIEPIR